MGMHIRPDGIVSFHGWENPIVQAQHTMQDLHEMLGHIGQAKIEDYLKQVTDITVKGSRTLGQCDACSQAKHTGTLPPARLQQLQLKVQTFATSTPNLFSSRACKARRFVTTVLITKQVSSNLFV